MAAAMVHHQPAALNPEPSQPEERAAQHLPPKTYVDVVEEPTPDSNHAFQANGTYRPPGPPTPGEYSGSGMGNAPQSPQRGHRRVSSKPSNSKLNAKVSRDQLKTSGFVKMENEDKKEDIKQEEPKKEASKKEEKDLGPFVQEKYKDANGKGDKLTSIRPSGDFEAQLRQDKIEKRPRSGSQLVSGRRAGAGWENSSVRWAPMNVPLKRRLQTAMVLLHTLSIALFLTFFFWLCAIPFLWPIIIPYLIYILTSTRHTDGTLKLRSERLRRWKIWSLFASYFPARMHRTQELPATRKYIFGYHPHGIISHGAFVGFGTEAMGFGQLFPGITNTLLTLDSNFRIPLYRDYALRLGLASVSRESCENLLTKGGPNGEGMGRAITIVVGGARESLEATPGKLRLVLKRRLGFVKLAIRTGADLVPVMAFGENDIYEQVSQRDHPLVHKFQLVFKKVMGFTVPLFHARGVFNYDVGLMPYRRPINIVVGKPIMVRMQEKPDPAYVEEIHGRYVQELMGIWNDWKDQFAKDRDGELELID